MISAATLYGASAAAYLAGLAAVVLFRDRFSASFSATYRIMAVVLGMGALASGLLAGGIGTIPYGATTIDLPGFVNDLVAYPLLWYVAARIGGAPKRLKAIVTGLPIAQVMAFQLGAVASGPLALLSSLFVIGGHFVLAYLFMGPIWRHAQAVSDERRLLHWKARNLLLFLIGMLIVFAFISLAGGFTTWSSLVTSLYIDLLIRVGFAGFLLVNVGGIASGRRDEDNGSAAVPGRPAAASPE
jgi:hypothetical protein